MHYDLCNPCKLTFVILHDFIYLLCRPRLYLIPIVARYDHLHMILFIHNPLLFCHVGTIAFEIKQAAVLDHDLMRIARFSDLLATTRYSPCFRYAYTFRCRGIFPDLVHSYRVNRTILSHTSDYMFANMSRGEAKLLEVL